MTRLLIDENLPATLAALLPLECVHATDFGQRPTDLELWSIARAKDLIVLTRDSDFFDRLLLLDEALRRDGQVDAGKVSLISEAEFWRGITRLRDRPWAPPSAIIRSYRKTLARFDTFPITLTRRRPQLSLPHEISYSTH